MAELKVIGKEGYFPDQDPLLESKNTATTHPTTSVLKTTEDHPTASFIDEKQKQELIDKMNAAAEFWATQPGETGNVMNRVLLLLIDMTKMMQNISIEQANQLTILTKTSNSYVLLQQNVPTILKGSSVGIFNGDSDESVRARSDANNFLSIMMESIRSNKGISEDNAKKVQTLLNASKESATQFSDLFTTLLDQTRTLVSKLFR